MCHHAAFAGVPFAPLAAARVAHMLTGKRRSRRRSELPPGADELTGTDAETGAPTHRGVQGRSIGSAGAGLDHQAGFAGKG